MPHTTRESFLRTGTGSQRHAGCSDEIPGREAPLPCLQQAAKPNRAQRIVSLDQFRGYTVAGMLLVNFLGGFVACPHHLKHSHDYFSYADTIMPQFLFAVGFAFRLTFGRRDELEGSAAAYGRVVRRMLGLALVSFVVYTVSPRAASWQALAEAGFWEVLHEPLKCNWFQTLMHITVTSLWLVPVIRAGAAVRIAWMVASAVAHVALSAWFNFEWLNTPPDRRRAARLSYLDHSGDRGNAGVRRDRRSHRRTEAWPHARMGGRPDAFGLSPLVRHALFRRSPRAGGEPSHPDGRRASRLACARSDRGEASRRGPLGSTRGASVRGSAKDR